MHNLLHESQKAIINLPPRNDTETEVFASFDFPEGLLKFEGQEFIFPEGFHVEVSARWLEEDLLMAEIELSVEIEAECARCLKPVTLEISGKLLYLYHSRGAEAEDEEDFMPVEVDYFGRVLDVMPQINESLYTLMPTKILCREDCKGLCPNCGADLNEGECSCKEEISDPRLEALRNFKI
ncbi:MAG: DUF177 domain-containing protein [Synergistaceae bacterium]|nr:DUF177 domain-containing protein [Synergistaceae bacterium]